MANHLTPSEMARKAGLQRRDVIVKCVELGVPIFNGRIDKTLFLTSLRENSGVGRRRRRLTLAQDRRRRNSRRRLGGRTPYSSRA